MPSPCLVTIEITQVRVGVEARVKAAMSHGGLLQAELNGIKAVHDQQLAAASTHIRELQEHIAKQQEQLDCSSCDLDSSREQLAR